MKLCGDESEDENLNGALGFDEPIQNVEELDEVWEDSVEHNDSDED